eukprot:14741935-Ditylum_brightwellii.AAC.1
MSGIAKQSNTEAHQLVFTAEETHSKGSASKKYGTEDSLKEREKSAASKFALRNPSVQKGSALIDATNSAKDNRNTKNTKSWTINKLRFNE